MKKKINKKKRKITWYVEPVPKVIIPDSKSVIEIQFGPSSHVLTSIGRPRIVCYQNVIKSVNFFFLCNFTENSTFCSLFGLKTLDHKD